MKKILSFMMVIFGISIIGNNDIQAKQTLPINSVEDWNNYHNNYNKYDGWNISINANLDFKNKRYGYSRYIMVSKNTSILGNNHTFKNMNINGNTAWVSHNFGSISNLNFDTSGVHGGNTSGFIKYNYGTINNVNFRNSKVYGTVYVAPISKNYRTVRNVKTYNNYIVGNEYVGGVVALNSNYLNSGNLRYRGSVSATVSGINANKTVMKSWLAHNRKKYRDGASATAKRNLKGDYFGGIIGKNYNASLTNSTISNTSIYADDSLGSVVGFHSFKRDNGHNKKAPSAIINGVKSVNFVSTGGNRVGGLVGFATNNNKIGLKSLSARARAKKLRTRIHSSSMSGNLKINAANESGGAIGMSLYSYTDGTRVNVNNKSVNVYTYSEEAGGFVGDLEFGYIASSKTNASVKVKKRQAGGFAADSEGTILGSHAYGNVYGRREVGGFVGSNLGTIKSSSFRGKLYAASGKKKNKAVLSGNFVAYKTGVNKYRGFKLKPRYSKCYAGGKRYVNNKRVKNVFYGRGGQGN